MEQSKGSRTFARGNGGGLRLLLLALSALLLVAGADPSVAGADPSVAGVEKKDHTTLELASGESAKVIELAGEPGGAQPSLSGSTNLFVRLADAPDPMLYARYVPDRVDGESLLCGGEPMISLNGAPPVDSTCAFTPTEIKGKNLMRLRLELRLPVGTSPSSANGSLILGLNGNDQGLPIPITASLREFKNVTVSPASLTLNSDDPTSTVTLSGAEVLEYLRTNGSGPFSTQLRSASGDFTTAIIRFPTAGKVEQKSNPTLVAGTVKLTDGNPPAGSYSGKVLLSDLTSSGPTLDVNLNSHLSLCLLVILAFVGVLISGVATRLYTLAMRRAYLLKVLRQTLDAYRAVQGSKEAIQSWSLVDLLDERPGGMPDEALTGRLQGLPALLASIAGARSSKDLDEDGERVRDMVARIQRWLRVEPAARRLALVYEEGPTRGPMGKKRWRVSFTALDSAILLDMAKREPADAKGADDLVRRLLEQARWHHRMVAAWERVADEESTSRGGRPRTIKQKLVDIEKKLKDKNAAVRSADEQDHLDAELDAICEGLEPPLRVPAFPNVEEPSRCELIMAGITPANWEATPFSFTGWATLDAQSLGQLTRRTATSARKLADVDFGMEWRSVGLADAITTLAALAVAALGYGVTSYGDTWGSLPDLGKALLAGVTGTIVIDWATLPIFQSLRLRAVKDE